MIPVRPKSAAFTAQAKEFALRLHKKGHLLVSTHTSPDGDAVASLLAAAHLSGALGCDPHCFLDGGVPRRYRFLPGSDGIESKTTEENDLWDLALIVDSGSLARIGQVAAKLSPQALIINVDHHADNKQFGQLNIVYSEAASTTEILFDLAQVLNLPISEDLATLLYTGLLTDTGGFRHSNTTERAFSMAAQLLRHGVKPAEVAQAVYASNSPRGMKLLGEALSSLELNADGKVATMIVHQSNAAEELEDLAEYALTVEGVQAGALLRIQNGTIRVSLRGRGAVVVADIARRFGGGGHAKAAGFTHEGDPEDLRLRVVEALSQEVKNSIAHPAERK